MLDLVSTSNETCEFLACSPLSRSAFPFTGPSSSLPAHKRRRGTFLRGGGFCQTYTLPKRHMEPDNHWPSRGPIVFFRSIPSGSHLAMACLQPPGATRTVLRLLHETTLVRPQAEKARREMEKRSARPGIDWGGGRSPLHGLHVI